MNNKVPMKISVISKVFYDEMGVRHIRGLVLYTTVII